MCVCVCRYVFICACVCVDMNWAQYKVLMNWNNKMAWSINMHCEYQINVWSVSCFVAGAGNQSYLLHLKTERWETDDREIVETWKQTQILEKCKWAYVQVFSSVLWIWFMVLVPGSTNHVRAGLNTLIGFQLYNWSTFIFRYLFIDISQNVVWTLYII